MENETEDEILARALEESLRHYREVELPRLTQTENQTSDNLDEEEIEIGGVGDWDCWEEWDEEQVENAIHIEKATENGGRSTEPQATLWKPEKNKCSNPIDGYIHREVLPRQSNVSVGESGSDGADGFDKEAGRTWIYPCNFPVRKYQLDIVHSALFDNTLVSLPTGLGKTFIAAVVMYNFYRWFPRGKIIFLAPTRPLVAQQIHACYNIMGIPPEDTAELTEVDRGINFGSGVGGNFPLPEISTLHLCVIRGFRVAVCIRSFSGVTLFEDYGHEGSKVGIHRAKAWKDKRVFFATPQVLANDLGTGVCPGELVRCVVVDEAHRAAGNHAICQSFRSLFRLRDQHPMSRFRVVALSATPGRNPNAVAGVVSALQLSKLELRDDLSPDVAPYTHRRNLETVVVSLGPELSESRDKVMAILDGFVDRLTRRNLLHCKQKSKLTKFQLLLARENFRKNAQSTNFSEKSLVEGDFATCITLVHALGLLLTHGERTFMSFVQAILSGDKGSAVVKNRLNNNIPLLTLLQHLQEKLGQTMLQPAPNVNLSEGMAAAVKGDKDGNQFITSHPKMNHLRDIVVKHFESFQASGESTRAMIFCEFRDPVVEICNMLMQHWPLVKPMSFVGQSSSIVQGDQDVPGPSRGTKGFTQKQQLQVIRGFRDGGYNVLVSTCVGEEGLDIGEVDLIVCYDAPHASPLRLVQRMGRTGRKREGRVVTLVTKEIEEQKHRQGLRQKSTIVKSLLSSKLLETSLCRNNARVLPPDAKPSCHMMPMTITKLPEEGEIKSRKTKVKAEKTITVEDMFNKGTAKEVEGKEVNENDAKETSSRSSKGKGKGKTSKGVSKVKPGKGIKEFFKAQKAKVLDTIVLSDENAEDDDFVGPRHAKVKSKYDDCDDGDEIIAMEEDVPTPPRSPFSPDIEALSPSKGNCEASLLEVHQISSKVESVLNEVVSLPSDLQALENSLSFLFGTPCCNDSKVDFPYRCSVIMSHFRFKHEVQCSHNISAVYTFDSITVDALESFVVEKEARKIGKWCQKSAITDLRSDNYSLTRNYGVSPEKYGLFARNHRNDTTLTSVCHPPLVLNKDNFENEECNKSNNTGLKTSHDIRVLEVIDILDSDEEMTSYTTSFKKKPPETTSNSLIPTAEEGLLWNVLGRKESRTEQIGGLENISVKSDSKVLKQDCFDSNKASCFTSCDGNNYRKTKDTNICDRNSGKVDEVILKFDPSSCNDKLLSSPDIIEDGYFGSQERTPKKGSSEVMQVSKDQLHGNADILGQPVLASSTPKVHRKNLFSPKSYLPSPIGHRPKNSSDIVDILPVNEECIVSNQQFPYHSRSPSPTYLRSNIKKLEAQGRIITENMEYPNFNLGSEYEFSSSDETVFEPEVDPDLREADFYSSEVQNSVDKQDEDKILLVRNNSSAKYLHSEQSPGILPPKVEKSSDLFETTSADASKTMSSKNKQPKQLHSERDDVYNHSFTITQAVNMLVHSKNLPMGREKEKFSERIEVNLKEPNETHECPKFSSPSKLEKLLPTNEKSIIKKENMRLHSAEEKLSHDSENVPSIWKNSSEKVENLDIAKPVGEEINFDIGDDILLDLSADLFAEGNAEGDENSNDEAELGKLVHISSVKTPEVEAISHVEGMSHKKLPLCIINKEIMKGDEKEVYVKSQSLGNGDFIGQLPSKLQEPAENNNNEQLANNSRDEFPIHAPGISDWSANGWLSKGTYSNKSKFSLGLKGIKRQIESEGSSEKKIDDKKSRDLKANNLVTDKVTIKPSQSVISKRGDNKINGVTSGRTILEAIDDFEENILCKSPTAASGKKGESIPSNDSFTCSDFQDQDLVKNITDHQLQSCFDLKHKNTKNESKNTTCKTSAQKKYRESEVEDIEVVAVHCVDRSRESREQSLNNSDLLMHQRKNSSREFPADLVCDLSDWEVHLGNSQKSGCRKSESSDDDFVGQGTSFSRGKRREINCQNTSNSSDEKPHVRTRRIRRKRKHEFLDTQAEESFVEMPGARGLISDEEEDDDGRGQSQYYDPSFINDGGHNSQETEVDMHAKYLQSVRSPRNAKFKIPNLKLLEPQNESELESEEQAYHHDEPDSYYMNDSFCVDSNGDEKEESVDELEVLEAILANDDKSKKTKRRKKEKSVVSSDEQLEIAEVNHARKVESKIIGHRKKRKRKRIVVHDSSDEDEEHYPNSPSKRSCRNEADIPIIDEKLLEELSQDLVEEPSEGKQVGGKCYLPTSDIDRSSVSEFTKVSEKGNKYSCESKLLTHNEKISENLVNTLTGKGAKNNSSCDSVVGLHEQRGELGGNSTSIKEKGKKHFTQNDEFSVNWSSDLFNFSDDEDELFSVIKSPPHISNSSSTFKVPPVPASGVSSTFLENNRTCELTGSLVNKVNSKQSESKGILLDDCLSKVGNRTAKDEVAVVNINKSSHPPNFPCLLSKRSPETFQQNNSFHLQRRSSSNESSPDPRREMTALSRPSDVPSSSHDDPLVSTNGGNKTSNGLTEVLVIVSPVEACRSSEVMSALRAIKGVRLVVYAASGSPSIPYCLGRDSCLLRVSSAGLGRHSKTPDAVQAAFNLFHKVTLIVEWEKECDGAQSNWSKKKSNSSWNSGPVPASYGTPEYIALLNLRTAGVNVLHSSGLVETAKLIAEIARHEQDLEFQSNMPPVSIPSSFDSSNQALKFYASLPGLNTFQALGLFLQFPKINDFLVRCKSARSIQMATYLDLNKSLHLHKILANIHVSDTCGSLK